jgi:SAM-dependent methyltransferase
MAPSSTLLERLLRCPKCHGRLEFAANELHCASCGRSYPHQDGKPNFVESEFSHTSDSAFAQEQAHESSLRAKLFNLGSRVISSDYTPVDQLKEFVQGIPAGAAVVELGSGSRRLREDVVNLDLFGFPNVDVMSDIQETPLAEATIDYVVLDTVLEHVPNPQRVVGEIHRILKPGGRLLCITPFIFNYHGYPNHYCNFSKDGLEEIFRNFSDCTVAMNIGPSSALTNLFSEYFALALSRGNKTAYTIFKGLFLIPVFYLKYLDRFWVGSKYAHRISSTLCATVTK